MKHSKEVFKLDVQADKAGFTKNNKKPIRTNFGTVSSYDELLC